MPTSPAIKDQLRHLPEKPGVYRMYDAAGRLLYVGKAKNLKNRVSSYFHSGAQHTAKTRRLVTEIVRFDVTITASEIEALLLEDNWIKQERPPYNILLKDDKRYPWLCLTGEPFSRLIVTRKVFEPDDTGKRPRRTGKYRPQYFGPYSNVGAMYQTLQVLRKHFPLRQRRKPLFTDRPCMNYAIGACPGPCQNLVSEADYEETKTQIALLLRGKTDALLDTLTAEMTAASEALNFEWAAKLRDRAKAVEHIMQYQQVVHTDQTSTDADMVGLSFNDRHAFAVVLQVRGGKLIGNSPHRLALEGDTHASDILEAFLPLYYGDKEASEIPEAIYLPFLLPEETLTLLAQWLSEKRQSSAKTSKRLAAVTVQAPKRRLHYDLVQMAVRNAEESLRLADVDDQSRLRHDPTQALLALQEALGLPDLPHRMECYDISHMQGSYTVASMVVFVDGQPAKSEYRRFNIKCAEGKPDDFASMAEVIRRRLGHWREQDIKQDGASETPVFWDPPDLLIIDGGKGQLSSAKAVLDAEGLPDQPIISLAKKFEEVFRPGESRPLVLPRQSNALFLLQQIRDEAHRFAITHHRKRRGQGATVSWLDGVAGLGEKRRQVVEGVFPTRGAFQRQSAESAQAALENAGLPKTVIATVMGLHGDNL